MDDYVEAENVAEAVRLWDAFNRAKDPNWDEGHTPEPDGIWPVESDNPVIRAEKMAIAYQLEVRHYEVEGDSEKMRQLAQDCDSLLRRCENMKGTIRNLESWLEQERRKVSEMQEARAAHVDRVSRRFKRYRTIIDDLRRQLEDAKRVVIFPYSDGDFTVIGPECIAKGDTIMWKGEPYRAFGNTQPGRDLQAERDAPMGGSLPLNLVGVQVWTWRGNSPDLGVVIEVDEDEDVVEGDPDPYYVVRFCSDVRKSIERSRLFISPVDCAMAEIEQLKKRLERSEERRKRETELLQKLRKRVSDHVASLQKAMR